MSLAPVDVTEEDAADLQFPKGEWVSGFDGFWLYWAVENCFLTFKGI